jgi:hypothetical protein
LTAKIDTMWCVGSRRGFLSMNWECSGLLDGRAPIAAEAEQAAPAAGVWPVGEGERDLVPFLRASEYIAEGPFALLFRVFTYSLPTVEKRVWERGSTALLSDFQIKQAIQRGSLGTLFTFTMMVFLFSVSGCLTSIPVRSYPNTWLTALFYYYYLLH